MFGSLKKRLKDAISKVSKSIKEEPLQEDEKAEIQELEEIKEEIKSEPLQAETAAEEAKDIQEPEKQEAIEAPAEPEPEEKLPAAEETKRDILCELEKNKELSKETIAETERELEEEISRKKAVLEAKLSQKPELNMHEELGEEPEPEKEAEDKTKEIDEKEELPEELRPDSLEVTEMQKAETAELKPKIILEKETVPEPQPEKKASFLSRIFKRVKEKTLSENDIEKILKELQLALLENDTALEAAEKICSDVKAGLLNKSVKRSEVEKVIKESLKYAMLDVMSQEKVDLDKKISEKDGPFVIVFFGFNGTGKTTTIAKFAHKFRKYKPIFAAGDTFRAASIEQLEEHGRRLGVEVVKQTYGSDSAAVIFDAVKHAKAIGSKLVLADTAGRAHSNANLMDELKKVCKVNNPDLKVLVLDSITGNDIYEQSRLFNDAAGVDAMVLTKADVYEKGGAALSASHTINKPILFLGVGQEYSDLKEFDPEEIVKNLLE